MLTLRATHQRGAIMISVVWHRGIVSYSVSIMPYYLEFVFPFSTSSRPMPSASFAFCFLCLLLPVWFVDFREPRAESRDTNLCFISGIPPGLESPCDGRYFFSSFLSLYLSPSLFGDALVCVIQWTPHQWIQAYWLIAFWLPWSIHVLRHACL